MDIKHNKWKNYDKAHAFMSVNDVGHRVQIFVLHFFEIFLITYHQEIVKTA